MSPWCRSAGAGSHGSQILRPGVTEAARQSVADPLGDLDLKRVVPGIAIALVLVTDVAELRERP